MKKSERIEYMNKKPVAVYGLTNCHSIIIKDILAGEAVIWQWAVIDREPQPGDVHISKINYGVNKTTFRAGRYTIDLSECMRV